MQYLSGQEILYIHSRVVEELGGRHGIRDVLTLKKAASYIQNNDVFPDKFTKAGALFFALSKKKPFIELNIPTALAVTKTFLYLNKQGLEISKPAIEEFIRLNLKTAKVEDIACWLQENSKSLKDR